MAVVEGEKTGVGQFGDWLAVTFDGVYAVILGDGGEIEAAIEAESEEEESLDGVLLRNSGAREGSSGENGVEIVGRGEADGGMRFARTRGAEHGVSVDAEAYVGLTEPVFEVVARGVGGQLR